MLRRRRPDVFTGSVFAGLLAVLQKRGVLDVSKEVQNDRSREFIGFANRLLAEFESDFKPKKSKPTLITGRDLIKKFGLKPSPQFKIILDRVEEERLLRSAMSREEALALVKKLITEVSGQKAEDR